MRGMTIMTITRPSIHLTPSPFFQLRWLRRRHLLKLGYLCADCCQVRGISVGTKEEQVNPVGNVENWSITDRGAAAGAQVRSRVAYERNSRASGERSWQVASIR